MKNVQFRSARFFWASSTDVLFWPKLACSHLFGQENISPSRQKNIFHRYWSKKMPVDVGQERWPIDVKKEASPHDADRTFPYRHHAYFIKELNRKLNSRHRSWSSPDWYFSVDIGQFLFKNTRWPIMFSFTAEEVFLFWCCIKNVQCRSAKFFWASSTDVLFRPKLAYSHLFGQENISPSRQKNIFHRYWSKKMPVDFGQERWPIEVKKEASPHDVDRTFPYRHHAYFIKGLNRKLNSWHLSWSIPTDIFQLALRNFFLKMLAGC